jgi:hypothetical protein
MSTVGARITSVAQMPQVGYWYPAHGPAAVEAVASEAQFVGLSDRE